MTQYLVGPPSALMTAAPNPGPRLLLARGGSGHNVVVVPGSSVPVAGSHGSLPPVPQSSGRDAQLPGDLDWSDARLQESESGNFG